MHIVSDCNPLLSLLSLCVLSRQASLARAADMAQLNTSLQAEKDFVVELRARVEDLEATAAADVAQVEASLEAERKTVVELRARVVELEAAAAKATAAMATHGGDADDDGGHDDEDDGSRRLAPDSPPSGFAADASRMAPKTPADASGVFGFGPASLTSTPAVKGVGGGTGGAGGADGAPELSPVRESEDLTTLSRSAKSPSVQQLVRAALETRDTSVIEELGQVAVQLAHE